MPGKISSSMMCCDLLELGSTLGEFEKAGVEYLHIDVMDGVFVPNYSLGTDYIRMLRRHTSIPLDIHLMIMNPEAKLNWFDFQPNDFISVHYESTPHIHRAIAKIKDIGAKAMLAINPGTPLACVTELVDDLEGILIMAVNPGFAGQSLIPMALKKIARLKHWLGERGHDRIEIEVDGNVSFENAKKMRKAGADIFVAGSSSIYSDPPLADAISRFRRMISYDHSHDRTLVMMEKEQGRDKKV
ncbi:MAG: ribulose-phosphate 3-epimerase [Oscillospiraceae bacterium]|nr:ribulose-phosphate 3-epimerase [Oscillospiraceae bacterium]